MSAATSFTKAAGTPTLLSSSNWQRVYISDDDLYDAETDTRKWNIILRQTNKLVTFSGDTSVTVNPTPNTNNF